MTALGIVAVIGLLLLYAAVELPEEPERAQTSVVVDADGNVMAELYREENREDVRLDQIAPVMQTALVAAEDRSFFSHSGLDPVGIGRALWSDVRGRPIQGGSTLTQQLVKNTYLSPERSLTRKVKEAILATKVERRLTKEAILERYLNTVYFGRGAYGVETAARVYFSVSASELNLSQAALLVGLLRAPGTADPTTHPEEATRRRAIVLDAMVLTGAVPEAEAAVARLSPLDAMPKADPNDGLMGSSAYFVAEVRRWAIEHFGERVAFGGGLRIETTLVPRLQQAAERAVFETLNEAGDPDAALVALDERGAVVAMIGGRDFAASNVNLSLGAEGGGTGRQPGSTFKPFVLASAIEAGIPVRTRFPGPAHLAVDFPGQEPFEVDNYGGESFGDIDLVDGTVHSVNTVYAQLAAQVGLEGVAGMAEKLGITSAIEPFPAMALGSEEVAPIEMANAYMTFARRGERVTPYYVAEVKEADGAGIFTADPERDQVLPRQYADVMNSVLSQVIDRGTGEAASIGRPAAGKTGTTSANTDAWFVGYTPRIGAAVWMGYGDEGRRPMDDVHGRAVTGGSFPAQIWQRFMAEAVEGLDTGSFVAPLEELVAVPTTTTPPTPSTSSTTSSTTTTTSNTSTTATTPETTTSVTAPEVTTTTAQTTTTVAEPTTSSTAAPTTANGNANGSP